MSLASRIINSIGSQKIAFKVFKKDIQKLVAQLKTNDLNAQEIEIYIVATLATMQIEPGLKGLGRLWCNIAIKKQFTQDSQEEKNE